MTEIPDDKTNTWTESADKLYELGLINATQAAIKSGLVVGREVQLVELPTPKELSQRGATAVGSRPKPNPSTAYRNEDGTIKLNRLSSREKMLADHPPKHIRDRLPYPR